MANILVREAISRLQREAFSKLQMPDPEQALQAFIDGFAEYVDGARRNCWLAVLTFHDTATDDLQTLRADVEKQFNDWQTGIASVYESMGFKSKRARRMSDALLAELYGSLLLARLRGEPKTFTRAISRLHKDVELKVAGFKNTE